MAARVKPNPMYGSNAFKLGVFCANAEGGLTLTARPERWRAEWDEIVTACQIADRAGIEFFLPIARWKGYEGASNPREWSFETFTFAAALAGVTERIALFSTVHVPMVHPVFAAKALATIDHASHGRAGLNIVCGWNPDEFRMFGLTSSDDRYEQGWEWYEIICRIFERAGDPFDYDGRFYQLKSVRGLPPPVQRPRPVVLNAAFSPPGRDFAARASDFLFTTFVDIESGKSHIEDMRIRGEKIGREVGVYTTCHVVCRESQAEAEDYYDLYAEKVVDDAAVDYHMKMKKEFAGSYDERVFREHRKRFAGGTGTYPLIGTPEKIVEEMVEMHKAGFAGTTISFVNFVYELPFFIDRVLPLMTKAGLRRG